ncbi:HNH endonuclease [Cronobacter turicensis]|nr:HNH endonuclease [Cronobacter turicensis]ELQ6128355.1 HNH endonuclease [Cronobacter turicensis]
MIKLTKRPIPKILFLNEKKWTQILIDQQKRNKKPKPSQVSKYRHKQIKKELSSETNGKCAYCESKLQHIHHGDVEHIYPKSLRVSGTFEWNNLTLACEICNQNKSDKDPDLELILNPYEVDPSTHIFFESGFVCPLTKSGVNTEKLLSLNRPELIERRLEKTKSTLGILTNILNDSYEAKVRITILEDFIKYEMSSAKEYSAMVACVYDNFSKRIPAEIMEGI